VFLEHTEQMVGVGKGEKQTTPEEEEMAKSMLSRIPNAKRYENNLALLLMPENKKKMLAFLQGAHKKLGKNSIITKHFLDQKTLENIYLHFGPPPIPFMMEDRGFNRQTLDEQFRGIVPYVYKAGRIMKDDAPGRITLTKDLTDSLHPIFPFPGVCIKDDYQTTPTMEIVDKETNIPTSIDMEKSTKFQCVVKGVCYMIDREDEWNQKVLCIRSNPYSLVGWQNKNKEQHGVYKISVGNDCVAMAVDENADTWYVYPLNEWGMADSKNGVLLEFGGGCTFIPTADDRCMGMGISIDHSYTKSEKVFYYGSSHVSSLHIAYVLRETRQIIKKRFVVDGNMPDATKDTSCIAIKALVQKEGEHPNIWAAVIPQHPPPNITSTSHQTDKPLDLEWMRIGNGDYSPTTVFWDTVVLSDLHNNKVIWITMSKDGKKVLKSETTAPEDSYIKVVIGISREYHLAILHCVSNKSEEKEIISVVDCMTGKILDTYKYPYTHVYPIKSFST
jgi:hypothetical protein